MGSDAQVVSNGTLLCSHHHHLIHKEHWTIQLKTGIPWFIPPPHLDPRQQPRRNHYFRPRSRHRVTGRMTAVSGGGDEGTAPYELHDGSTTQLVGDTGSA